MGSQTRPYRLDPIVSDICINLYCLGRTFPTGVRKYAFSLNL